MIDANAAGFWRRLLHRWFVEYNPFYLVSASLVLAGTVLLSRGLSHTSSVASELGIAAIAEIYSFALIGGAALLTRIGHRRPAVMLTLLTTLYQWDLTLHTETCAHLGIAGVVAAAAWVALFMGKLRALAWAMHVRASRRTILVAALAALGLAVLPLVLPRLESRAGTVIVTLWISALVLLARANPIETLVELDTWGHTVLRRTVRASWLISGLLLSCHVFFWSTHLRIDAIACALPLLTMRWMRRDAHVCCVVAGMLAITALALPSAFALTALVAAIVLAYRAVVSTGRAAPLRLATGAGAALYLALWTYGWAGGPWPHHVLPFDALFTMAAVFAAWRWRMRLALGPLSASALHLVVQSRLVPPPRTALEWGGTCVGLGFLLLIGSLVASYVLRPRLLPERSDRHWPLS